MRVGIRELRDRLRHYVETARSGEDVIISDHGHAIARLVALQHEPPIDRLIKAGLAAHLAIRGARSTRRRWRAPVASAT